MMQKGLGVPGCIRVQGPKADIGTIEPEACMNWKINLVVLMGLLSS